MIRKLLLMLISLTLIWNEAAQAVVPGIPADSIQPLASIQLRLDEEALTELAAWIGMGNYHPKRAGAVPARHLLRSSRRNVYRKPKSIALTDAAAFAWALLSAGWLMHHPDGLAWLAIVPFYMTLGACADRIVIAIGYHHAGRYPLIDEFVGKPYPSSRWHIAENDSHGEIITADATALTGLPPWLQRFYADWEQDPLQGRWGGDVLMHFVSGPFWMPITLLSAQRLDKHEVLLAKAKAKLVAAQNEIDQMEQLYRRRISNLEKQAAHDPLTGLPNRRSFHESLTREISMTERVKGRTICFVMIDADTFKQVNDIYGHIAGDVVLKYIAKQIQKAIRHTDLIGRLGGEEFAVALLDANPEEIEHTTEKIRKAVDTLLSEILPDLEGNPDRKITVSLGVTPFVPGDTNESLVRRADMGLYRAKRNGRNRAEFMDPILSQVGVPSPQEQALAKKARMDALYAPLFGLNIENFDSTQNGRGDLITAIRDGQSIVLRMDNLDLGAAETPETVRKQFDAITKTIGSTFQKEFEGLDLSQVLDQLLKDAFLYGNKLELRRPLFFRVDLETHTIKVLDFGIESGSIDDPREIKGLGDAWVMIREQLIAREPIITQEWSMVGDTPIGTRVLIQPRHEENMPADGQKMLNQRLVECAS